MGTLPPIHFPDISRFIGFVSNLLLFLFILALLVPAVIVGRWIHKDARLRGRSHARLWSIGVGLLTLLGIAPGVIGFAVYIITRDVNSDSRRQHRA